SIPDNENALKRGSSRTKCALALGKLVSIGDVPAVERQQVLYSRYGGSGNVKRVSRRFVWHESRRHNLASQGAHLVIDCDCWHTIKQFQPFCGCHRVASRSLVDHKLRCDQLKAGPFG
ncbi:MAG: hypothetical protein O2820_24735, partial [Planctomycetota bacterium]|nr:hypothetical protein [Planctomycetota bacterium]